MTDGAKLIDSWLRWMEHNKGRTPMTCTKYRGYLGQLSGFLSEEKAKGLLDVNDEDLEEFVGIWAHRRGQTARSRRATVAAVKVFYRWCVKCGYLADDPSEPVPYPKAPDPLPIGIEKNNLERLIMDIGLDSFLDLRDTLIVMVLAGCGLRLTGLVNLNEGDLIWTDLDGKHLLLLRVTEKGRKQRIVPAPPQVWALMRAYLAHEDLRVIDRQVEGGDKVLFVSVGNRNVPEHEYRGEARRLATRSVDDMIKKRGKHALIPKEQCHPHAFRHCYGTELAEGEVNLPTLQALMGHDRPRTTGIYIKLAARRLAISALKANPLAKIKTPADPLARELDLAGADMRAKSQ